VEVVLSPLEERVERLAAALLARSSMLATAESCTGGLIAAACTERPGSSTWFERGFVTYSNAAKREMLGVAAALIDRHGAVSGEVAAAMAEGALARSTATFSIAVTGIAGPGGGSPGKPVGTVCFSVSTGSRDRLTRTVHLPGSRFDVRDRSTTVALHLVRRVLLGERPRGSATR